MHAEMSGSTVYREAERSQEHFLEFPANLSSIIQQRTSGGLVQSKEKESEYDKFQEACKER